MSAKLRVVMHVWPSVPLPGAGTVSFPAWIAAFAAAKNATALQAPTWVKAENSPLMFSPATQPACCNIVSGVPDAAGPSPVAGGSVGAPAVADAEPDAGGPAGDVLTGDVDVGAEEDGRGW